ncbi:hypothetical protein V8F06_002175 [Rhypophila decipiens]
MASLLGTVGATLSQEIQAWRRPSSSSSSPPAADSNNQQHLIGPTLKPGVRTPKSDLIQFPRSKPVVVVFLRHCGCPFAEKTFRLLTKFSSRNHNQIHCIAVTQASSREAAEKWVIANGGEWDVEVLTDPSRELYARWGLGLASAWQVFGPMQVAEAYKLGVNEGIWGNSMSSLDSASRPGTTEYGHGAAAGDDQSEEGAKGGRSNGNRWQMGGVFAVDEFGIVRWAHVGTSASDMPDLKQAKKALVEARRETNHQDDLFVP